jgi:hypothetical protein
MNMTGSSFCDYNIICLKGDLLLVFACPEFSPFTDRGDLGGVKNDPGVGNLGGKLGCQGYKHKGQHASALLPLAGQLTHKEAPE